MIFSYIRNNDTLWIAKNITEFGREGWLYNRLGERLHGENSLLSATILM